MNSFVSKFGIIAAALGASMMAGAVSADDMISEGGSSFFVNISGGSIVGAGATPVMKFTADQATFDKIAKVEAKDITDITKEKAIYIPSEKGFFNGFNGSVAAGMKLNQNFAVGAIVDYMSFAHNVKAAESTKEDKKEDKKEEGSMYDYNMIYVGGYAEFLMPTGTIFTPYVFGSLGYSMNKVELSSAATGAISKAVNGVLKDKDSVISDAGKFHTDSFSLVKPKEVKFQNAIAWLAGAGAKISFDPIAVTIAATVRGLPEIEVTKDYTASYKTKPSGDAVSRTLDASLLKVTLEKKIVFGLSAGVSFSF